MEPAEQPAGDRPGRRGPRTTNSDPHRLHRLHKMAGNRTLRPTRAGKACSPDPCQYRDATTPPAGRRLPQRRRGRVTASRLPRPRGTPRGMANAAWSPQDRCYQTQSAQLSAAAQGKLPVTQGRPEFSEFGLRFQWLSLLGSLMASTSPPSHRPNAPTVPAKRSHGRPLARSPLGSTAAGGEECPEFGHNTPTGDIPDFVKQSGASWRSLRREALAAICAARKISTKHQSSDPQ